MKFKLLEDTNNSAELILFSPKQLQKIYRSAEFFNLLDRKNYGYLCQKILDEFENNYLKKYQSAMGLRKQAQDIRKRIDSYDKQLMGQKRIIQGGVVVCLLHLAYKLNTIANDITKQPSKDYSKEDLLNFNPPELSEKGQIADFILPLMIDKVFEECQEDFNAISTELRKDHIKHIIYDGLESKETIATNQRYDHLCINDIDEDIARLLTDKLILTTYSYRKNSGRKYNTAYVTYSKEVKDFMLKFLNRLKKLMCQITGWQFTNIEDEET